MSRRSKGANRNLLKLKDLGRGKYCVIRTPGIT